MKILFCGSCLPPQFERKVKYLSAAGNQYQNNLIKALKAHNEVKIISFINIELEISLDELSSECETLNIKPVITQNGTLAAFIKYRKLLKQEIKWADIIISYNVLYPWFGLGRMAAKYHKKAVAVVADYTPPAEHGSLLRKIYAQLTQREFSKYQKIVMLSPGVDAYLKSDQEKMVVNGCLELSKFENITPPTLKNTINIVYTGLLSKITGVDLLVESFMKVNNPKLRLIISGQGEDMSIYLTESAKKDNRIIFKGFVSREEYYEILQSADILVNPRNMNYLQNTNNFPSKVLEYIATGRVIISTKFNGYEEYYEHIIFVDSSESALIAGFLKAVEVVCEDASIVYEKNREFAREFGWEEQIDKFM
ncbi:glycosyltransferase family 4 protein [Priestia megaterium]|uniref:Glycosyltransferase family 4 protein n=1 Tax=Priestia megaterium TaxID=1404 RepID=A0A6H1NWN0_PRIMG|nr:glycosyltransferase family 4 protein [Priestia megaterium]QIZ05645.1 glycosyltransferase family 4 protein [Priestia megaterium]